MLQVINQGRDRLIRLQGIAAVVVGVVIVAVPAQFVDGVVDLHEANAVFDQAAAEQAHAAVEGFAGNAVVESVGFVRGGGFVCEIADVDGFGLHTVSELGGADAAFEVSFTGPGGSVSAIEPLGEVECLSLRGLELFWWPKVEDGVTVMPKLSTLMGSRQKGVAPVGTASEPGDFVEQYIAGQILIG